MFFGTNSKLKDVTDNHLDYEGNQIEVVEQYKYLGVVLDTRLSFDKHTSYLCGKIYPKLKLLNKIRCNIGQATSIYLYNCLLNPLFSFNDYIYDSINNSDANRLQVLQNNCIRACLKCDKRTSRKTLYDKSGVKPLNEQRKEHTSSIVYQGLNQISTPFINNMFTRVMENMGVNTRSAIKGDVHVRKCNLKISKGNIRVRGPIGYNIIPLDIREAKSVTSFRNRLKRVRIFEN